MQTANQAKTQATAHQGPRTKIYSCSRAISFLDLRNPAEGSATRIPPAVLTATLHMLASGCEELALTLIQEATKCKADTAADVIEFILEMVKPVAPKAFVIDDDHKARASKVIESALTVLMPKKRMDAMSELTELLDGIFKAIR